MEIKNTLNGFEAVFDILDPMHVGAEKNKDIDTSDAVEELTDEELEALQNKNKKTAKADEDQDPENDDKNVEEEDTKSKKPLKNKRKEEDDDNNNVDNHSTDDTYNDVDNSERSLFVSFFDTMAEALGWEDVEEEEKPLTAEDLVKYFKEVIEENSIPQYASEEMEKLDEFVRNGGDIKKYFSIDADLDLDNLTLEDNETNQKTVVREFLKEKGFSAQQISKKLSKYEDAGLLEDEAEDALEALKEIKQQRKEKLLADQQKLAAEAKQKQQDFFNNVLSEIKGMDSIYGIDIPEKDKRALLEYIFKPDANGLTKYLKDYAKSLKNLITSAYFTMKGDTLIDIAKKKGKRDALDNFKDLTRNSGVNKKSKRQINNNESNSTIWDAFARQLRVA